MIALKAFVAFWVATYAVAQRRYYNLNDMPVTNFDCRDKILGGYYADPEANCQMFHVCVKIPGQGVQDFRFLCPNETVFDQEQQICADSGEIDCAAAGLYLDNFDLYRLDSLPAKRPLVASSKGTPIPLGPSTKSPILTNQVQEDDDFYLQRSETGDRRLHSKDLLRGSSSSNLFNNRNRGKDLDDDDADDDSPRNVNETPQSYRPKPHQQSRGKSQYNTQFRRPEPTPTSTTTTTTTTPVPRIPEEKKRGKVAIRKLSRKRPTTPEEVRPTPSSFTTLVTQKFSFGEVDQRYSTINRSPAPSTPFPQQPPRQYQQNFRTKVEPTSTSYQPNNQQQNGPSTTSFQPNYQQQNGPSTTAFQPNYQQQTVQQTTPSYQPNYQQQQQQQSSQSFRQQDRSSTPFQNNNYRPASESSTPAFFEPVTTPTPRSTGFNGRPIVASNFQPRQQEPSRYTQPPVQETYRPSSTAAPVTNFQSRQNNQQFNRPQQQQQNIPNPPQNQQFNRPQQQIPTQNQQFNRPPQNNFQNNQQQQNQQFNRVTPSNNQNFDSNRQPSQQQSSFQNRAPTTAINRPTPAPTSSTNFRAQTINAALQPRPTPFSNNNNNPRQNYRNDDFDDGDKQEFLKTAPSSNFRPSDINSFSNNYKSESDKGNVTKFVSTTKYYTPTIVTTPKPVQVSSTARQQPPPPPPSGDKDNKDASYDYAYYDDAGSFSEYDALDALGETDFSRTSKRTKSRLI